MSESAKQKFNNGFKHGMLGYKHSEETKQRISEKQTGKKQSLSTKTKRTRSLCKNVYVITYQNNSTSIIDNIQKFCRNNNYNSACIYNMKNRKLRS